MRFLEILLGAAAVTSVLAAPAGETTLSAQSSSKKRQSKFQWSGINESGAEFGNTAIPGQLNKDYIWPAKSTIDVSSYVAAADVLGRELSLTEYMRRLWLAKASTSFESHS